MSLLVLHLDSCIIDLKAVWQNAQMELQVLIRLICEER